jgi:hypothetical protein
MVATTESGLEHVFIRAVCTDSEIMVLEVKDSMHLLHFVPSYTVDGGSEIFRRGGWMK